MKRLITSSGSLASLMLALALPGVSSAQSLGSVPFYDGFESTKLAPYWNVQTIGTGYAATSVDHGPLHGNSHLLIASNTDQTASEVEVTVALDLQGESGLMLGFSQKEFDDEDNAKDGVWISSDGTTWHKVKSLVGADGSSGPSYQSWVLDLDAEVAAAGLTYTSPFYVSLQWRDNFDLPLDGFAFDDFWVRRSTNAVHQVPGGFSTIQSAIAGSADGDVIIVAPGAYDERVDFLGREISLIAEEGALQTSIVPSGTSSWPTFPEDPAVRFINGEDEDASLIGFTVTTTGFMGLFNDVGIWSLGASPLVKDCVITNNHFGGVRGDGVFVNTEISHNGDYLYGQSGGGLHGDALLVGCRVNDNVGNDAAFGGGGGGLWGAPTLVDCVVENNVSAYSSGGGWAATGGAAYSTVFRNNATHDEHDGGGVKGPATLIDCLIIGNKANGSQACGSIGGGGVAGAKLVRNCTVINNESSCLFPSSYGGGLQDCAEVVNSIVWGNTSPNGLAGTEQIANSNVTYSTVEGGYPGLGNSAIDALLDGDFKPSVGGSGIDSGNPGHPLDTDGSIIDRGFHFVEEVDCDDNGHADSIEIALGVVTDCNLNGFSDACDVAYQLDFDFNNDGILDTCLAPPLGANVAQISTSSGGTQEFVLTTSQPGDVYLVLGSTSGTSPGQVAGAFQLPLNQDAYFSYTIANVNLFPLTNSLGFLDAAGNATASFILPPFVYTAFVGLTVNHAFATFDAGTLAVTSVSNPVPVELVP